MNIIGTNIKGFRQKNGWNQGEVAKRLNISIPAFSKIETGITDINISRLWQIADLFNVSTMDIISKAGEHPLPLNSEEINELNAKIMQKEEEIIKLQKKLIELHEEIREKKKNNTN